MLSVAMLSVTGMTVATLSVDMMCVVMLNVVAPSQSNVSSMLFNLSTYYFKYLKKTDKIRQRKNFKLSVNNIKRLKV